jgi:gentisate 1,2-dioxygenase
MVNEDLVVPQIVSVRPPEPAKFEPSATSGAKVEIASVNDLSALNLHLLGLSIRAGWNLASPSLWEQPRVNFEPYRWRWCEARAALSVAGKLIDTELAERRALALINPREGVEYGTLRTLVSAYQMIRPGEVARSHRHTPNALRLILEGQGSYSTVDGQRIQMSPGDVVLTPGGCWHGHGNDGVVDCYWIDFLDVPLVHLLEPMFFQRHPQVYEPVREAPAQSPYLFHLKDVEEKLQSAPGKGHWGRHIILNAPSMRTIGLSFHALCADDVTPTIRTTTNNLFAVVRGTGQSTIGKTALEWSEGDVIAVPAWQSFWHTARADTLLLRVSDEPTQKALGYWVEQVKSDPDSAEWKTAQ